MTKSFALILLIINAITLQAFAAPNVLLTAFEPFSGRKENLSLDVALRSKELLHQLSPETQVQICRLPVVYDKAAEKALECVDSIRPDIVISLGEGDCNLRLETAAHNWDDTPNTADSSGQIRNGSTIIPGGEMDIGFNLPVQEMYCAIKNSAISKSIFVSETPGQFVCNNTAYRLAYELATRPVEYGFVHVPPKSCGLNIADYGDALVKMIQAVIKDNFNPTHSNDPLPHHGNSRRLPTTLSELDAVLKQVDQQEGPQSCHSEFLRELRKRF